MEENAHAQEAFLLDECEVKPNRHAARAILYAIGVLILTWAANELGIYRIDKWLMREGAVIALLFFLIPLILINSGKLCEDRRTKYVTVVCVSAAIFVVNVLMSFHTMVALILPMLLAMQYKSKKVGITALFGSLLCTFFAPVVSFLIDAWDTLFLQVLLELADFSSERGVPASRLSAVGQIMLYISLPEVLMVAIVAIVMFAVIQSSQKNLNDQIGIKRSNARIVGMQDGILEAESGTHFDASLVEIFLQMRPEVEEYVRLHVVGAQ